MTGTQWRTEHDLLGERRAPADAYWGIHTFRAMENFPVSGVPIGRYAEFVRAYAQVKHAAALANHETGAFPADVLRPLAAACDDVAGGGLDRHLVVDVLQGGAETATNMNVNEVLANRALERAGLPRGRYDVIHPLDHVNAVRAPTTPTPRRRGSPSWRGSAG